MQITKRATLLLGRSHRMPRRGSWRLKMKTLDDLNTALKDVESNLMARKIERQDATIDDALEIINMAQEAGSIEVDDCAACGD